MGGTVHISARGGRRAFTLVELLAVIALIALLASLAVPSIVQTRISANETSAISTLRVISKGMEAWRIRHPAGYPTDYKDLASEIPPDIDPNLANGVKSGYTFEGGGDVNAWHLSATPLHYGASGTRSFYVDGGGGIHFRTDDAPAGPSDPCIQ